MENEQRLHVFFDLRLPHLNTWHQQAQNQRNERQPRVGIGVGVDFAFVEEVRVCI